MMLFYTDSFCFSVHELSFPDRNAELYGRSEERLERQMARELLGPLGAAMFVYSPHSRATFEFICAKLKQLAHDNSEKTLCWQETLVQTAYGYKVYDDDPF